MDEKKSVQTAVTDISHVPAVAIAPPPRCYHRLESPAGGICGELARWLRPGRDWFAVSYFCDAHRLDGDQLVPVEHVFRRVRVLADLLITGVATNAPLAQTEAVARLEAAIRAAGGVLDVHGVRSYMVRSAAVPGGGLAFATSDAPE